MVNKELTSLAELEEFVKEGYAVIDCYGDFCSACVMLAPVFAEAASDMAGIRFGKINATACMEVTEKFGIEGFPTVLCFRDGVEVHRVLGSMERPDLNRELAVMLYN